jgi:hypothetical protein
MSKRILVMVVLAVSTTAATAAAAPSPTAIQNAQAACRAQQGKIGAAAFTQAFGAFGACVTSFARVEQQNLNAARAACTAEQSDVGFAASHDGQTFAQFYGNGPSGKNAFARCVSAKLKASSQAEGQTRPNPARLCTAERTARGTGFAQFYGTPGSNFKNAWGKCVSAFAKAQVQNELSAAATCRAEQGTSVFSQTFGTNANAFGKCVGTGARAETLARHQATMAALASCSAERKADPAAFRTKYGSFRSCVNQQLSS